MQHQPLDILQKYWGYSAFRPLQQDIIQSVLDGKDTLALLPTGGGKSICFQVPALCREGICIVVSPLIALMKDQVFQLEKRKIPAAAIYSGMHYRDIDRILDNCVYGTIKLLYLSPERLRTELAQERISRMNVNLLAVDEAHCISQWGYDFRPPYLEIAEIRELMPKAPVLALTATATPEVVSDIQEKLNFREKNIFQQSFSRKNLAYVVLQEEGKEAKLLDIVKKVPGAGVIYARNRRKTKDIALYLKKNGIEADYYHAGLDNDTRSAKQDAWIQNKTRIIVSTNAFGMGIDKPDVRTVVHLDLPDNLEAYFQEAGRAGRDGKKSYAVLLYNSADKLRLEKQFEQSFPDFETVRHIYRALGSHFQLAVGGGEGTSYDFDIVEFSKKYKLDPIETLHCLKILEQGGWIVLTEAVFVPSQLKVLVSKEQLYDYQLRHPKFDPIIKTILRTYQGAFQYPVALREGQVASFLNMSRIDLTKVLEKLHQDAIIEYRPQKDQPQIIFLHDRIDADNLTLDRQLYSFRKNRHYERIQKAIAYAETPRCRSQQLLAYFGETDSKPCGICDVCLGRTEAELSSHEFDNYRTKIQQLLVKEQLTIEEVVDSFPPKRQQQVILAVQYLLDEGIVEKVGNKLVWKKT